MKSATWESSVGALATLINTGEFVFANLYTITLADGAGTLRYTSADLNIVVSGHTYSSRGVRFDPQNSRQTAHWKRGLDVDSVSLIIMPRVVDEVSGASFPDTINGIAWGVAARQGALDGADVQIDRAYFSAWPAPYQAVATPTGTLTIFAGYAAEVDVSDSVVALTVLDYRGKLRVKMPRNVFQAGCRNTLFDTGCALSAAAYAVAGSAIGGSTRSTVYTGAMVPGGSGTFTLGKIKFSSGLNAGFSRTVREWTAGTFKLLNPLPFDVIPGDTFNAYPGCDKQSATCALFSNTANFGGFPTIPAAETAL